MENEYTYMHTLGMKYCVYIDNYKKAIKQNLKVKCNKFHEYKIHTIIILTEP